SSRIKNSEMFELDGVANQYAATFRGHQAITVPGVEPGFTNDYSVVWAVSRADLKRRPQMRLRFYNMHPFISTFLIASSWGGDSDHYAELTIPSTELS